MPAAFIDNQIHSTMLSGQRLDILASVKFFTISLGHFTIRTYRV
jgi:hypothetical protein